MEDKLAFFLIKFQFSFKNKLKRQKILYDSTYMWYRE